MTARLLLFGSPIIEHDGACVALPFERRHQVLVYLALKRTWVGRAELAAMLWPEQPTKLAYTNLRKTLFRLQSLAWGGDVEMQAGALRVDADTDVHAFDSALRERRLDDALALRRGELLAGFDDEASEAWSSWLGYERERLRLAWRDAALARLASDADSAVAVELSSRLLEIDPLDEAALRVHMSALARSGNAARARQAYRQFVDRLASDLGLAPPAELKALHDTLATTIVAPPSVSVAAAATTDAAFVGRAAELRRIASLVAQDDCRLLTIVGAGGVGKTRLARRAMDDLAPGYADGVAFVALEDVASASELAGRLARELGIALEGSAEPLDQAIAFLRDRAMLLVLDSFEHLAADASIVERLLHACPRVKAIVTSRARLALAIEWLLPLDGLPCPEFEDRDRAEAFDAVRLFVQAAQRVEPALVPAVEAASIVDICRQVEGLPLALELAAAWTRVLSCDAIAAELRQGTELLRAVDPARPTRHASIEVVFDQSWRLLSAIERAALARLSIFRGGFSPPAARAIAGASLPVLGALADKSLVRKDGARIFLHPLLLQLAALRLAPVVRDDTEHAHALYFNRLLAESRRAVEDGERDALHEVDVEFENCRIAWRWAISHDAAGALAKSAPTLLHFCDHRGRLEEGLALLREAVESRAAQADSKLAALLGSEAAHLEYRLDRYADAQASAERALEAARPTHDHDTTLQCFKVLGACSLRLGRHDEAKRYFRHALEEAPTSVDPHNAAAMLDNLALVEKQLGRYDESARLSTESLVEHRRLRDVAGEALCLNNLGALCLDRGLYDAAVAHLRDALAICERHGLVATCGLALANLAEIAAKTDDDASALRDATRALEIAQATGNRAVACWLRLLLARLALRRGDFAAARDELAASLALAIAVGRTSLKLAGVSCFAEMLDAQGERACAQRVLAAAAEHPAASAAQRAEIVALIGEQPLRELEPRPMPDLDELVHRIVVETAIGHAPLIATLRGAV